MVDWTISDLRELLEMCEENGDGDRIIRFDYDGEPYQLDWPICFKRNQVPIKTFTLHGERTKVVKDTADFMLIPDDRNLSKEDKVHAFLDSLEEVRQMLTDGKLD